MSDEYEYRMTHEDFARMTEIAWQVKSLGEAQQCQELSSEAAERLAEIVAQLGNELTYIAGEKVQTVERQLRSV